MKLIPYSQTFYKTELSCYTSQSHPIKSFTFFITNPIHAFLNSNQVCHLFPILALQNFWRTWEEDNELEVRVC